MSTLARRALVLILLAGLTACAAAARSGPRKRPDLITLEEIQRTHFHNLYDLVQALRPRWLQTRGPDTIVGPPTEVQVWMDGSRLGGVQGLRSIPPLGVVYLQFFDAIEASARWGLDHGQGAILVSSRPR